jgi:protein-S-isoprenylcysteine O-methyltransferase Ste14|tara:strand:+ start:515 stop:913 length:399 start_codon:yes stop_codon:yes gene_type:complete
MDLCEKSRFKILFIIFKHIIRDIIARINVSLMKHNALRQYVRNLRVILSWLAFFLLISLSINSLISESALTIEVWVYLLLTPAALAFALSGNSNYLSIQKNEGTEVSEDIDEINTKKNAPDPVEDGFDVPVL